MNFLQNKPRLKINLISFIISFTVFSILPSAFIKAVNDQQNVLGDIDQNEFISPLADDQTSISDIAKITLPSPSLPTPSVSIVPKPTPLPSPTSTPVPLPTPVTGKQLDGWFKQYASFYNIPEDKLRQIAVCESELNPAAFNSPYAGLYQFTTKSWTSTRQLMNQNSDPELRFNAEEAIKTAAFKLSTEGIRAWPHCSN